MPAKTKEARVFEGSVVPLVTPFRNGAVDEQAFARLVERQLRAGSHGLSVGGTTGEPAGLSLEERKRLIRLTVELAGGRRPVLAGTGSANLEATLELTRYAREAGADGALVITPYYTKPSQEGLFAYFARVAEAVPEFPLVIYNIPGRACVPVAVETLARLRERYPWVVGVKHSLKDLDVVSRTIRTLGEEFAVFCGLESLTYPMLALGARGMIAATANLLPSEVARLYEAVKAGRHDEARELHYRLYEVNEAIFWETNPVPLKYLMARAGLIEAEWRPPLGPPSPEVAARLDRLAAAWGWV